ncbi:MAG: hypothetical protein IJZ44_06225 [Lachnospiraceae bacterium]|nr:hypothetical protein [Lachnospiraceae bacterium]
MGEKKLKVLTVRLSNEQEREDIRYVMRESGIGTATQAMIFACSAYRQTNERKKDFLVEMKEKNKETNARQIKLINTLMAENERLRKSLKTLQDNISNLHELSKNM